MVAQHGRDRHLQRRQFFREHLRFLRKAVVGEIAGEEEHVSGGGNLRKQRLERALRRFRAMQVRERGDADD